TFGGGEPQPAIPGAAGGRLRTGRTFARRQPVGFAVNPAGNQVRWSPGRISQRFFLNAHQSRIGTDPQTALVVLDDVIYAVAGEAIVCGIAEPLSLVKARQAVTGCANPQSPVLVQVKTGDIVAGQSV